jgi:hypothetical protein
VTPVSDRNRVRQSGRAGKAKRRVLLLIFAGITASAIAARGISRYFGLSFGLAMIGATIAAYGIMSVVVVLIRRRLVARVNRLPPEVQDAWRRVDPVVRHKAALPPADGRMSARAAVWLGGS